MDKCSGDWATCRANTIKAIFNSTTTPSRAPDHIMPYTDYRMKGLPGPGTGTGVGNVQWENNLTALICPPPGALPSPFPCRRPPHGPVAPVLALLRSSRQFVR